MAIFFLSARIPGEITINWPPPPLILEVEQVYVLPSRRPFLGHFSAPLSLIFKPIFSSKDTIYTWVFNKFKLFFLQNGFKINWYSLLKYLFFSICQKSTPPKKMGKKCVTFLHFGGVLDTLFFVSLSSKTRGVSRYSVAQSGRHIRPYTYLNQSWVSPRENLTGHATGCQHRQFNGKLMDMSLGKKQKCAQCSSLVCLI